MSISYNYKPKMVNIPVRVSTYSDLLKIEKNMYLYYSWNENEEVSVAPTH